MFRWLLRHISQTLFSLQLSFTWHSVQLFLETIPKEKKKQKLTCLTICPSTFSKDRSPLTISLHINLESCNHIKILALLIRSEKIWCLLWSKRQLQQAQCCECGVQSFILGLAFYGTSVGFTRSLLSITSCNPLLEVAHCETKCYVEMGEGGWVISDRFLWEKNVCTYLTYVIIPRRIQLGHNYRIMAQQLHNCCTAIRKN